MGPQQEIRMPKVILIMGVTGVGKSTFIKHATGKDVVIGHGQSSCTSEVDFYEIPDKGVFLMDTPGFDDTHISDTDILKTITERLVEAFKGQAKIHGAIYIHPVVEARMRGSGRKNLIMFTKVLGTRSMKNCLLVTTKWGIQDHAISEARERELCEEEKFWKPLITAGARVERFNDSRESAIQISAPLYQGPSFQPLIIEEVVMNNVPLAQTQAGRVVNDDIEEAKKTHAAEIRELRKGEKEARDKKDDEWAEILRKERKEHEDKVKKLAEDARKLAQPVEKNGHGIGRWVARGAVLAAGSLVSVASGGSLAPVALLASALTEGAIHTNKKAKVEHSFGIGGFGARR